MPRGWLGTLSRRSPGDQSPLPVQRRMLGTTSKIWLLSVEKWISRRTRVRDVWLGKTNHNRWTRPRQGSSSLVPLGWPLSSTNPMQSEDATCFLQSPVMSREELCGLRGVRVGEASSSGPGRVQLRRRMSSSSAEYATLLERMTQMQDLQCAWILLLFCALFTLELPFRGASRRRNQGVPRIAHLEAANERRTRFQGGSRPRVEQRPGFHPDDEFHRFTRIGWQAFASTPMQEAFNTTISPRLGPTDQALVQSQRGPLASHSSLLPSLQLVPLSMAPSWRSTPRWSALSEQTVLQEGSVLDVTELRWTRRGAPKNSRPRSDPSGGARL